MELNQESLAKLRQKGKESLFFFAKAILGFHELDPIVHRPVCQMMSNHQKNKRVIVVLPRTWFKSTLASIAYPIWRAINDPNIRILIAQNSYDNACKKLKAIAGVFEKNQLFKALYPEILPDKNCKWSNECLEVRRSASHPEGTFEAVGVGTTVISRHYDLIIEDDTIAPKKDDMSGIVQQPTQLDIEKAIGWHGLSHPLQLHPTESQIMIVGTRWAERDLIGYVMDKFPEYVVITRAISEDEKGIPCPLDAGGKIVWDRFNEQVYHELERVEGPYMFACLYLNRPTAAINQTFKRDWIQYYDKKPKECYACTSVDLASAEKTETSDPDYNVVLTTGIEPRSGRIFVIEYTRKRMSPSEVIDTIFAHYHRHSPMKIIIEAIGYQRTLIHWLKRRQLKQNISFYVEELKSLKGSKADRILGLQPYFANMLVALRTGMSELEHELLGWSPTGKGGHDDIVDALSMHRKFWVDMIDMSKAAEPVKRKNPLQGGCILDELTSRFKNAIMFPFDMGNNDDVYLNDEIGQESLRERIRDQMELSRRNAAYA